MEAETLCRPDKQQQLWADCEIGVIIHYSRGLLGMQNLEGVPCDQAADASKLNPENLDTDQWLASAAELGAKYAVFVANQRNCQGISLWQSSSNPYSLKQSPYQNGRFDCVEAFIRSCKKYHILPGLYYQTGYGGHYFEKEKYRTPGTPEHERYLKVTKGDLTELWTKYGSLFEIWFDGGADSLERTGLDVGRLLEEYQPGAICFQGPASHERNLRWIGNEDGIAACDTWSTTDQRKMNSLEKELPEENSGFRRRQIFRTEDRKDGVSAGAGLRMKKISYGRRKNFWNVIIPPLGETAIFFLVSVLQMMENFKTRSSSEILEKRSVASMKKTWEEPPAQEILFLFGFRKAWLPELFL